MNAYIYLRVSTSKQARSGLGIDAQKKRCLAMAEVKGWIVDPSHIFIDDGISGTHLNRPELKRMLDLLKREKPAGIIVASLDRLARKTKLVLSLVEDISKSSVLVSCKESLDTGTAVGHFVLTMFAALAELEAGRTSERTTEALESLKAKGMQYAAIPYGFERGEAVRRQLPNGEEKITYTLKENPAEQEVIELVKSLRGNGLGFRRIASELNRRNIPPRSAGRMVNRGAERGGVQPGTGLWSKTQVCRILGTGETDHPKSLS